MNGRRERSNGIELEPAGGCPGGGRPYFLSVNDRLADKGFLVTTADELINWARTGSLMWMTFGLACCAVEMMQASMPRYDVERFGFAPRGSPRQSDVMIVAGTLTNKMAPALRKVYDRICRSRVMSFPWAPAPMAADITTIPIRSCAAATGSCLWISTSPGCPPSAEALLYGILLLQKKIRRTGTIER